MGSKKRYPSRFNSDRMMDDVPGVPWCGEYILGGEEGHTPVPCYSLQAWGRWLQNRENRIVARTGNEDKFVSTVFLGFDHQHGDGPPLVFETMLFIKGHGEDTMRYSSWEDAEIGHKAFVRKYLINPKTRTKVGEV